MLNNEHFFFRLRRKYIIAFGNLFNNINLIRYEKNTAEEVQRIKVPIVFGPKDKMITKLTSDPDLQKSTQIALPRMSFNMTNMNPAPERKQQSLLRQAKGDSSARVTSQYMGVPFDFEFELAIYTKTIDDGDHIIEQILPRFNPDYTTSIIPIEEIGVVKDVPIVLKSVVPEIEYEGDMDSVRYVYWTLTFVAHGYFWGPITQPKVIKKAITNILNDPTLVQGNVVKINVGPGNNGTYRIADTVYQGNKFDTATAYGIVTHWNPTTSKLTISGTHGAFTANADIKAASTNAVYQLESFDATPVKLATIEIVPDPIDANYDDDYGYTTTITEWPETET